MLSGTPFDHWFDPPKLFSEGYPKDVTSALRVFPDLAMEIQRIVVALGPRRALEIGPGDRPLIGGIEDATYLDLVPRFLKRLRRGRAVLGDVRELPFREGSFDLVVAADLFTHVPPAERSLALDELTKVAAKILIFNPEAGTPEVMSSPVSTEDLVAALEDAELSVDRRDFVAPAPRGVYRMVLVLAGR